MDKMVALLSTFIAYMIFLPCLHIILKTFIPGLPEGISFEKLESRANPINWVKMKLNPNYMRQDTIQDVELAIFGGGEDKIREQFGELNEREKQLTRTSAAGRLDFDILKDSPELPTFAELVVLLVKDGYKGKVLADYVRSLKFKIVLLFKLTFGWWDDSLVRNMHIEMRAMKFDEDPTDEEQVLLLLFAIIIILISFFVVVLG